MMLVILVVFVFLRDVRSTLIPSVAVPISLVGTFGVMYLLGYSIDNLSLMALTIATGFVVDDAIVVIENITRYLEQGMRPLEAAMRGAKEIGFTVVSISASLVAVFIPILLMQGIVGRIFREFAVTLSVAIVVSLVVSLTTTPMMCATLLRHRDSGGHNIFYRASEWVFNTVLRFYEATLAWVLRRQFLMLLVTVGTVAATIYLYIIVPKGFFPQQDTGRLTGSIIADQDTSSSEMQRLLRQFAMVTSQDPATDGVIAFTGGGGRGGGSMNTGRMFINLKPESQRSLTADEVIGRLRGKLSHIPGATLYLQSVQDLRVGGRISSTQYQYSLQGQDLKELSEWTVRMLARMQTLPGLVDVVSDQQNRGLQAQITIDRATASRLGLTSQMIDDALYDAFGQRQVSTMYTELNQYHVVMELDERFAQDPTALENLYIRPPGREPVPLSSVARYALAPTPLAVNHQGQFPATTISFNLRPGTSLSDVVGEIEQTGRDIGLPVTIRGSFAGTAQAFQDSLSNQPILIARRARRRLHRARHPLREPDSSDHDPLDAALRRGGGDPGPPDLPHRPERHRPDRHHPAHRHCQEERDPHDRFRTRRRAIRGKIDQGVDLRGLPAAFPPDHHDDHGGPAWGDSRWRSAEASGPSFAARWASPS